MAKTVADPRVLQATNQPNMLQNLQVRDHTLDFLTLIFQLQDIKMRSKNIDNNKTSPRHLFDILI
jgi:hypothetical protein